MHPSVLSRYISREWFNVCGEKFLYRAELQYFPYDRILVRKGRQCGLICRITAPGCLLCLRVQLQLVEKYISDLLRGRDIELRLTCHFPDSFLPLLHLLAQSVRKLLQLSEIHLDPNPFHLGQNPHERLLHIVVKF